MQDHIAPYWIPILLALMLVGGAGAIPFMLFYNAGRTILRVKGYGLSGVLLGIPVFYVVGLGTELGLVFGLAELNLPAPAVVTISLGCVELVVACCVVGYWAAARRARPRRRRAIAHVRRIFPYGRVGAAIGWAAVPVTVLLGLVADWLSAVRVLVSLLGAVGVLLAWERRYRHQVASRLAGPGDVLYLRGFAQDDRITLRSKHNPWASAGGLRGWVNLDQYLYTEVERRLGRFVALGSPRDILPPGGARRRYTPDEGWQDEVRRRAVVARAVLMQPDVSEAVRIELEIIQAERLLPRFFLITPPAVAATRFWRWWWRNYASLCGWREATWAEFAAQCRDAGLPHPVDDPGPGAVVAFDATGTPIPLAHGCTEPGQLLDAIERRLVELFPAGGPEAEPPPAGPIALGGRSPATETPDHPPPT